MKTNELQPQEDMWQKWEKEHRKGKIFGGIVIVIAGSLFLAKELGVVFPIWFFTWKTLLISFGLLMALKKGFKSPVWLIPIIVGGAFLVSDIYPELALKPILWPILIIIIGLFIIFKPNNRKLKKRQWEMWQKRYMKRYHHSCYNYYETDLENHTGVSNEDILDITAFMGGVKKNILSKNFKYGDITCVLAGSKFNFSQADFSEKATIEITVVFGSTQLIVPSGWDIKSEVTCVFGSVEDKRLIQPAPISDIQKTLLLKGTVFFGGIEIKNY